MLPELNLRAPGLLVGLCYRCLAGDADPAEAPVMRRRLDDLKADETELSLELSRVRADLQIARDKAMSAARELEDSAVDVRLFEEKHPLPPARRGLLGRRPGREDAAVSSRRRELERLMQLAREADRSARELAGALVEREKQLVRELAGRRSRRQELSSMLRRQYAAAVLEACAAGDWSGAESRIRDLRQVLRADASIAVLGVLAGLFRQGTAAGRQAVLEYSGLFESHPPQVRRIVEALLAFTEGGRMDRSDLGLVLPGQVEWDGLYLLQRCTAVLSGWQADVSKADNLTALMMKALSLCRRGETTHLEESEALQAQLLELAGSGDVIVRTLCTHRALMEGWLAIAAECSGVAGLSWRAAGKRDAPPGLVSQVEAPRLEAWPAALQAQWRTLLCCQALLAAHCSANRTLFEHWLAESYGWPKSDFYWWVLAQVKRDPGLLRNVAGTGSDLVPVARI